MENKDLNLLLERINGIREGNLSYAKADDFENPENAKAINEMIDAIVYRNNHFLVRINDAMHRIADNSSVKKMLDEINAQTEPIKIVEQSSDFFKDENKKIIEETTKVYALSKQTKMGIQELEDISNELQEQMKRLSDKDCLDSETEREFMEVTQEFGFLNERLNMNLYRINDMVKLISEMYRHMVDNTDANQLMFSSMVSISESFSRLFSDCLNVGGHLYRISRDIDNARNDIYRQNSWPLLHDRLKVFEVDHLTLTWRLYNHAVEYETLRITQVNNPDGCKFGLWANKELERGSDLSKTVEFQAAIAAHYELHDHAVNCFLLKESYKNKEALAEFEEALKANTRFAEALDDVHKYLVSVGIADETEVWKFEEAQNVRLKL